MLNKICTDLTVSRKLRILNVDLEFETGFAWKTPDFNKFKLVSYYGWFEQDSISSKHHFKSSSKELVIPAYTLEQILDMLPMYIEDYTLAIYQDCIEYKGQPEVISKGGSTATKSKYCFMKENDENLATTAAKLLIKLKEDKII